MALDHKRGQPTILPETRSMTFHDATGICDGPSAPYVLVLIFFLALCLLPLSPAHGLQPSQDNPTDRNVDVILAVDLSKSMRGYGDAADIFNRVQQTTKDLVRDLKEGDTVTIIPFGDAARALTTVTIYGDTERRRLFDRIDGLTADQSWTYTAEALRLSLQEGSRLRNTFPDHRQVVFILTDGRNNPPPGSPDRYDLDVQQLAEQSPSEPWYVYQVQYGDQIDQALDSLIAESEDLDGGTVQDEEAEGGVDSLRTRVNRARSFSWSASPSALDFELDAPSDSATASVEFDIPEGIGPAPLDLTLDRSALPEGLVLEHEVVAQPENRARLRLVATADQSLENGQYDGSVRVALPSEAGNIEATPLEIPFTARTAMATPAWLLWLVGLGGTILFIGGGVVGYRAWKKRQLFGKLEYWPTGDSDAVDRGADELDQFGMSANIGSDIFLPEEDEIGDLSVEEVDGRHLVVVKPRSGMTLKHDGKVKMKLALSHNTTFELGEWTFRYSGAAG